MAIGKDLTGQRFGMLTVIRKSEHMKDRTYLWECKCDCGKTTFVSISNLKGGSTKSCGCLKAEMLALRHKKNSAKFGNGDSL